VVNHPNRSRRSTTLRGHYREESGTVVPGTLDLRRDEGGWFDPGLEFRDLPTLYCKAREFLITPDIKGIEITGIGGQPFLPADGECERIGLPIERLA